ncbi:sulfur carrier protein ThiS [Sessilibacter corallicola]|uniref:sulfur carrier protein ThiS n=1 Tax=Sessilibacter corallicola TaxID=2904075 RepID=UPI001E42752A|nr:sulfur carrier protein ThiS [Sessilibacter corallicola]MCE2030471.1 sulfur carrier protein ThiS [Sessilibacter corallicola]
MNIVINGETKITASKNLAELLIEQNYTGDTIATALNGVFVAKTDREQTPLTDNCSIEIVAPVQGG